MKTNAQTEARIVPQVAVPSMDVHKTQPVETEQVSMPSRDGTPKRMEPEGWEQPKRVMIDWRKPGGRKPANTEVVARPSRFGNPFKIGDPGVPDAATAVALFETLKGQIDGVEDLRGKDLACYCRQGEPCHADVLLKWANETKPAAQASAPVLHIEAPEWQAARDRHRERLRARERAALAPHQRLLAAGIPIGGKLYQIALALHETSDLNLVADLTGYTAEQVEHDRVCLYVMGLIDEHNALDGKLKPRKLVWADPVASPVMARHLKGRRVQRFAI